MYNPQHAVSGIDEVTSLEYAHLKVHYELLNRKFRACQRAGDEHFFYARRSADEIEVILNRPTGDQPLMLRSIRDPIQQLSSKLSTWVADFDATTRSEIQAAETIKNAAEYLKEGTSTDPAVSSLFRKQRINRFIIEYLLRSGYFETAQRLAEYVGDESSNRNVFHVAKQVETGLQRRDLSYCNQWVSDNRSKLHRLSSKFEREVDLQQLIELIKGGKRHDAVDFMKKKFGRSKKWSKRLLNVMGLLAFGPTTTIAPYKQLVDDDRWDRMVDLFREENAKIFRLSGHSAFSACLQVGIAAYKSPMCHHDPSSRCVVCRELYDLADGLPFAHVENSRLICAATGDALDEQNRAMMLTNGRVYGERAIARMQTREDVIICPRTNESCPISDIKRIYVL